MWQQSAFQMVVCLIFIYTKVITVAFSAPVVAPVTIGLQYTQYTISDTADYEFVCAEVKSGSVAARDIMINYVIEDYNGIIPLIIHIYLFLSLQQLILSFKMVLWCSREMLLFNVWLYPSHLSVLTQLMKKPVSYLIF